jgi:hypothetical protein
VAGAEDDAVIGRHAQAPVVRCDARPEPVAGRGHVSTV